MKKILFSALMLVSIGAFAQPGNRDNNRNDYDKKLDRNGYYFSAQQRDKEIRDLNFYYDQKVKEAYSMRGRRNDERRDWISRMESERRQKIRDVYSRYDDRRNTFAYNDYKRH